MSKLVLAIDQGTTGTTVLAVDPTLKVVGKSTTEFRQIFPKSGWVEHDGADIWESVEKATEACLRENNLKAEDIGAIGITNQRETTCLFDNDGNQLHNFIVWQCRRTADFCNDLKEAGHEELFRRKTGLVLDPYFSGTKMRWLLDHVDGARKQVENGDAHFGTIDSWLTYRLTGNQVHVTDATNASRTLLMDLETCAWDDELCGILEVPKSSLPEIRSCSEIYGNTKGLGFLPDGIPVAGIAGDQQAALFGQACFERGEAKCTYGTGCFLLMNTANDIVYSQNGLLTTVGIKLGDEVHYALEGAAFIGGAAVQWLRDGVEMIDAAPDIEALAEAVESSGDVSFVPALAGLGAPHWRPEARGILAGLTRDTHKGHIARAVLEGIALQNRDILEAMRQDAGELSNLKVDGGASANNLLMQYQADVLNVPCVRPEVVETTALGAAALAGMAVGVFAHQDEVRKVWREDKTFNPQMSDEDRKRHIDKWQNAVQRA